MPRLRHLAALSFACALLMAAGACKKKAAWEKGKKVAHLSVRAKLGTLDPIRSSSTYDSEVQSQVYEGLFSYKYLVRPYELEPLLAKSMPHVSEDGLTYTIDVREGIFFQDNKCFEGGKGRELVAKDFVYSLMRMGDDQNQPTGWWLYSDRIVGFDAFEKRMSERGDAPFDWDAKVEGLQATEKYQLQIRLVRPFPQMLYVLAMSYAFAVPRECAEYYGKTFTDTAVGTGPFTLRNWTRGSRIILDKNPNYRDAYYPTEASPEFQHMLGDAGKKIPFLDAIVYHIYEQDQPMWLKFRVGDLDMTQLPDEYHAGVLDENAELRPSLVEDGVSNYNLALLDFIYRGFNMKDPVVGKGEKAKYLRQAISLAFSSEEINDAFYSNSCVLYDAPVPPGLDSYVPGITSPYRGPDLEKAKALMIKAGYPGGKGLPAIQLDTSVSANSAEQAEMLSRAVGRIGVKIKVNLNSFAELSTKLKKGQLQMFGLAWGGDYPDAENFLQLFYGPNEAPGSNNFNYKNPAYDALYNQSRTLQPGPERTAVYQKMREILIEDVPSFGHMARTRYFLWHKRLRNVLPDETFDNWRKYLNIVESNKVWPYIIRRLLWGIPILFGVTLAVFLGLHVVMGSPAASHNGKAASPEKLAKWDADHGFDKSYPEQYLGYMGEVVTMDFGRSLKTDRLVSEMISEGAGKSVSLTLPALILTSLLSICLALFASYFRGRGLDRGVMIVAVFGMSISFLVYIVVLQYLLAFVLPVFQIHGYEPGFGERWQFLVLPIFIQVIVGMGYDTRFYRSVFVEEIGKDHITTAYAKGASKRRVMFVHVLKNALIPIITRIMISIPFLVTGSLLLEQFFGIPGIGSMLLAALDKGDFPVIKALAVLISLLFIVSTILNDILYAFVDPRVRLK